MMKKLWSIILATLLLALLTTAAVAECEHDFTPVFHNGTVCYLCGDVTIDGEDHSIHYDTIDYEYFNAAEHKRVYECTCGETWENREEHWFRDDWHNGNVCDWCNYTIDGTDHSSYSQTWELKYVDAAGHKEVWECTCGVTWENRYEHNYYDDWHNGNVCPDCRYTKSGTDHSIHWETSECQYVNAAEHKWVYECTCGETWENREVHYYDDWHNGSVCQNCRYTKDGTDHSSYSQTLEGYEYVNIAEHKAIWECTCGETWEERQAHWFRDDWHNGNVCYWCNYTIGGTDHSNHSVNSVYEYVDASEHKRVY